MFWFSLLVEVSMIIQACFIIAVTFKKLSLRRIMIFDATMMVSWSCSLYTTFFLYSFDRNPTWHLDLRTYVKAFNSTVNSMPIFFLLYLIPLNLKVINKPKESPPMENGPAQEIQLEEVSYKSENFVPEIRIRGV